MNSPLNITAIVVFVAFFALVTIIGFLASRWKAGDLTQLHEWGLGGRQFGTWITWFLVGGDFYTAYTVIAVPAAVYGNGASGFFALPYTIIVYPFIFLVMPKLWRICHKENYITAADFVQGVYGGKWFPAAIAVTGIVATMPYIALQLIGMQAVIKGLGVDGEIPLAIAFAILALYTYASGIRAPAMIAFVKDIMIYIVVIAAVCLIPSKLGGYGSVFDAADHFFAAKGSGGIILKPAQFSAYASLALGSALAATSCRNCSPICSPTGSSALRRRRLRSARWCRLPSCRSARPTCSRATCGGPWSMSTSPRRRSRPMPRSPRSWSRSARWCSSSYCRPSLPSNCNCWAAYGYCKPSPPSCSRCSQRSSRHRACSSAGMVCGTTLAFMVDLKPLYAVAGTPFYIGLIALAVNMIVTFVLSAVVPAKQAAHA